jgi:hypothetical protein
MLTLGPQQSPPSQLHFSLLKSPSQYPLLAPRHSQSPPSKSQVSQLFSSLQIPSAIASLLHGSVFKKHFTKDVFFYSNCSMTYIAIWQSRQVC